MSYEDSLEEARELKKALDKALNERGGVDHTTKIELHYFKVKHVVDSLIEMNAQHKRLFKLINLCNDIGHSEKFDGYWRKLKRG